MNIMQAWRIWIYYRLSRDDDKEMNSLKNQRQILMDYIEKNGHQFVGESKKSIKPLRSIEWMSYL